MNKLLNIHFYWLIIDFSQFTDYLLNKLNNLNMKKLFLATIVTLSFVMVSCGGSNTETTVLTDSTAVDSTLVDTTVTVSGTNAE